jgi:hypothetical protein
MVLGSLIWLHVVDRRLQHIRVLASVGQERESCVQIIVVVKVPSRVNRSKVIAGAKKRTAQMVPGPLEKASDGASGFVATVLHIELTMFDPQKKNVRCHSGQTSRDQKERLRQKQPQDG